MRNFKFAPRQRLHQPAEFREVRLHGRRYGDQYFSLSVLPNKDAGARLGLAIATKTFGSAVARNRIKRITRESFRLNQHSIPSVDITVAARAAARGAAAADLRSSLSRLWLAVAKRG